MATCLSCRQANLFQKRAPEIFLPHKYTGWSWLHWYNGERPHQSLGYGTPLEVWETTAPLGAPVATLPPPPEGLLGNLSHGCFKPTLS